MLIRGSTMTLVIVHVQYVGSVMGRTHSSTQFPNYSHDEVPPVVY